MIHVAMMTTAGGLLLLGGLVHLSDLRKIASLETQLIEKSDENNKLIFSRNTLARTLSAKGKTDALELEEKEMIAETIQADPQRGSRYARDRGLRSDRERDLREQDVEEETWDDSAELDLDPLARAPAARLVPPLDRMGMDRFRISRLGRLGQKTDGIRRGFR